MVNCTSFRISKNFLKCVKLYAKGTQKNKIGNVVKKLKKKMRMTFPFFRNKHLSV